MSMKFSIVIPIYNAEFISYQLETISALDYSRDDFEVIYVDDGSDISYQERYSSLFQGYDFSFQYYYIDDKQWRFRVSEARNIGYKKSKYEHIIFIDADCLFPGYYLKNLENIILQTEESIILWQSIGYNHRENIESIIPQDIVDGEYHKYKSNPYFQDFRDVGWYKYLWEVFIGGNLYIKKSLLEEVNGWDEKIINWGWEDLDIWFRFYKSWYLGIYKEDIEVYNIKDEERINKRKILSFMKNQVYLIKKYEFDSLYYNYVQQRFLHTPVKYKIGTCIEVPEFRNIFFPKKNVLLYCQSNYGRGHFMRMLKIYHALSSFCNVKMIVSWSYTPHLLVGVNHFIVRKWGLQGINIQDYIQENFWDFLPDIFLIDFFPFWKLNLKEDIDVFINFTQDNKGKVFSVMRDIFDGKQIISDEENQKAIASYFINNYYKDALYKAYETWNEKFLSQVLIQKYIENKLIDGFLVFWQKEFYDISKEYSLSLDIQQHIYYLWYLLPEGKKNHWETNRKEHIVVTVSSGWGFHNKRNFLKLLVLLWKIPSLEIHFFPGDDISEQERQQLICYFSEDSSIIIEQFSLEYHDILSRSDIFFFSWGYNSFCDVLRYNIPAYVLWYGDLKTNSDEVSTRIEVFEKYNILHRLYDFDIFVLKDIVDTIESKKEDMRYSLEQLEIQEGIKGIIDFIKETDVYER